MHYSDVITQNIRTEYAKLVDENNYRLFRFLSVRDFEPKILIKGVHLTNIMKKGIQYKNVKSKIIYVTVLLFIWYSI